MPEGEPPLEDAREGRRGAGVEGAAKAEGVGLDGLEWEGVELKGLEPVSSRGAGMKEWSCWKS
jgi:hypothetical protein